jgi:hypothetical protein
MEIKGKVAVVPAPGPALVPLSAVTDLSCSDRTMSVNLDD